MMMMMLCATDDHDFYVLIETRGSNSDHDREKILEFMLQATFMEETSAKPDALLATDCVLAETVQQMHDLWFLRENITVALKHRGYTFK